MYVVVCFQFLSANISLRMFAGCRVRVVKLCLDRMDLLCVSVFQMDALIWQSQDVDTVYTGMLRAHLWAEKSVLPAR